MIKDKTFENYNVGFNSHEEQIEIIKNFGKSEYKHLLIFGDTGRGKTHLAWAIVNKAGKFEYDLKLIPRARFVSAEKLYFLFLKSAYGMSIDEFYLPKKVSSVSELTLSKAIIIDDLGKEKKEKDGQENFSNAFKILIDDYPGKIIITTNLNKEAILERYGEFICNRLFDKNISQCVVLSGKDYRMKK